MKRGRIKTGKKWGEEGSGEGRETYITLARVLPPSSTWSSDTWVSGTKLARGESFCLFGALVVWVSVCERRANDAPDYMRAKVKLYLLLPSILRFIFKKNTCLRMPYYFRDRKKFSFFFQSSSINHRSFASICER